MASPHVFDAGVHNFEQEVVLASKDVPVLIDMWAEWCGPCKTLGPVLDKVADEFGGAFRVAKVDTEQEQQLAGMFQIQSIPTCVLFVDGQPVDGFGGALPENEIKAFLQKNGVEPLAPVEEEPETDPDSPTARLGSGLAAARRGDVATASEQLNGIPEEEPETARAKRLLDGLEIFSFEPSDEPHAADDGLVAGKQAVLAGDFEAAVESFLSSMAEGKEARGALARRASVLCFEFLLEEPNGEDVVSGLRRRMATLLY